MYDLRNIRILTVILTADCNLACSYCYQNVRRPRRMEWDTLRASLDMALASSQRPVEVFFVGGEPMLELSLIQRAAEYVGEHCTESPRVKYSISTNGTLLKDENIAFLAEHRFDTQISFDGVAGAQDFRGTGTFAALDRLIDKLRTEQPRFLEWDVSICITLVPDAATYLPESIDYLLGKGVHRIAITPGMSCDASWSVGRIEELDALFERVFESSLAHWRRTGRVPVEVFRRGHEPPPRKPCERPMCGVAEGETLTVDVDGEAYPCTVFAGSYQTMDSAPLRATFDLMRMGNVADPRFAERYAAFGETVRGALIFHSKANKHSSYALCRECEHNALCFLCPVSILHVPGNADPDRVSDFCCAYYLTSLKYRQRFPAGPRPLEVLRGSPEMLADRERWRRRAEVAKEARLR